MLRPDLIKFKPKELAKSEEVNYNFEKMGDYVFGTADELKAFVNSAIANVNSQLSQFIFPGMAIPYFGKIENVPNGWLLCDGREVSRETYRNLFNAIDIEKYGKGNGVTTFNLPNSIDLFLEGGRVAGIYKEAGLPNITGTIKSGGKDGDWMSGAFTYLNSDSVGNSGRHDGGSDANYSSGTAQFNASRSSAVFGKSNTVQPPSVTVLYIIKT